MSAAVEAYPSSYLTASRRVDSRPALQDYKPGQSSRCLLQPLAPMRRHYSTTQASSPVAPPRSHPETIFSGIQPTGVPHIGNLLGAIFNWIALQRSSPPDVPLYFSIVGLHALTLPQDPATLRRERSEMLACLLACGLDPERCVIYHQDEVPEHAELNWFLSCLVNVGRLRRMTTWKGKMATVRGQTTPIDGENEPSSALSEAELTDQEGQLSFGLFAYPILQAADILLYQATHVPVGEDQVQHLELARDLAQAFNRRYPNPTSRNSGTSSLLFPEPRPLITPSPRILSLRDPTSKMSKSAPDPNSRIMLTDDAKTISSKIKRAVTDSERTLSFDPIGRPGVANLLTICAALETFKATALAEVTGVAVTTPEMVAEQLNSLGGGAGTLKAHSTQLLIEVLGPIRDRYLTLREHQSLLREVADQGADRARVKAREVLKEVKSRMGLI